jgi:glycerate 2-kinase
MKLIVAPDSFKESLAAREVAAAIARGIRRVQPDAVIEQIPMADGGEGTVDALVAATGGTLRHTFVTGPLGEQVEAVWGSLGDGRTAVLEMASASGLALVPSDRRNPLLTTTYGTGELILAALNCVPGTSPMSPDRCVPGVSPVDPDRCGTGVSPVKPRHIILGIGGSATNDGGTGAAQAAGVRFLDAAGRLLPPGLSGGRLADIARIDMSGRDPRIASAAISAACDVDNPLCGPHGAAAVYGPQKGATPEQLERLDRGLAHLADIIERDLGRDVRNLPGAGAAGGLGAGLVAFFDARLERGIELVMQAARFRERIAGANLIITGEGRLDAQSMMGKAIAGVAGAGKAAGIPVVALVGSLGPGAETTLDLLRSYHPITPPDMPLPEALARTAELLETTIMRLLSPRPTLLGG